LVEVRGGDPSRVYAAPSLFHFAKYEICRYNSPVLRGQDILVLVRLLGEKESLTIREIADSLQIDGASVHRSLRRLEEAQLVLPDRRAAIPQADEFLTHALRYVFPARFHGESRGVETAWAAEPLRSTLTKTDSPPPVWPHPRGRSRGIALEPLHPSVPEAALSDPELHARFALVDALRMGDARTRKAARIELLSRAGRR
jgi:hypothetical protein